MGITFSGMDETIEPPRFINLSLRHPARLDLTHDNVNLLFGLLRIWGWWSLGRMPLFEARRAVMGARARFDRVAKQYTREPFEMQMTRAINGEVVRGPRVASGGLDMRMLADRLERFAELIEVFAHRGASHICWH